jgi:hypothetical protein
MADKAQASLYEFRGRLILGLREDLQSRGIMRITRGREACPALLQGPFLTRPEAAYSLYGSQGEKRRAFSAVGGA